MGSWKTKSVRENKTTSLRERVMWGKPSLPNSRWFYLCTRRLPYSLTNMARFYLLPLFLFCRSSRTLLFETCQQDYHRFGGLSTRLTLYPEPRFQTDRPTEPTLRKRRSCNGKSRNFCQRGTLERAWALAPYQFYWFQRRMGPRGCAWIAEPSTTSRSGIDFPFLDWMIC